MITFGAHVIPNLADECLFKLVPLICPFEHFAFWYKIWSVLYLEKLLESLACILLIMIFCRKDGNANVHTLSEGSRGEWKIFHTDYKRVFGKPLECTLPR